MPRVVSFHFTLRDANRRVLDTSLGGEPVSYLEGTGQIIDGLEEALRSAVAGEKRQVRVAAAKAYGERDLSQVRRVQRSALPVEGEVKAGDVFRAGADPAAPVIAVVAVDGDEVVLDANHPLAGVDLDFDVEIIAVREAAPDELRRARSGASEGGA